MSMSRVRKIVSVHDLPIWANLGGPDDASSSEFEVRKDLNEKISHWTGDMTCLAIDGIVNAANPFLLGGEFTAGKGIDAAIHAAAGPELLEECEEVVNEIGSCEPGNTILTKGYALPAKRVLHTVGPKGEKPEILESCYLTSLNQAAEAGLRSIAFCCIATGTYGYPNDKAAEVALRNYSTMVE